MKSELFSSKPLSTDQLAILHHLYLYRFTTTQLLSQTLGLKNKTKMNPRLTLLLEQGYIGRNYEPSWHLLGRHATYYLDINGIAALRKLKDPSCHTTVLRNMYKDKTASERFINHWVSVSAVSITLGSAYHDDIRIFTTSQLSRYDYMIKPTPDLYFRLTTSGPEIRCLVDIVDSTQPQYVVMNRIKRYIAYAEDGEWEYATGTELPQVLILCDTLTQRDALRRLSARVTDIEETDEVTITILYTDELTSYLDAKKWPGSTDATGPRA